MLSSKALSLALRTVASLVLFSGLGAAALGLHAWKEKSRESAAAAAAAMPEPAEAIEAARASTRSYTRTSTAIGTVRALRSITLSNELAGTVRKVALETGQVVEPGAVLVEFDVAVESAQLDALKAQSRLAETMLGRMERALQSQGASAADVDRARAERDMAVANVHRLEALIDQKTLRAPFRARVGLVDLHVGQYLEPGTAITTLQGIDDSVHVDFPMTQDVAARLSVGTEVEVVVRPDSDAVQAKIVAIDARVDATTRNTWIRAELHGEKLPSPGASVRVRAPVAEPRDVVVVPVNALRRSPGGDSVFVLAPDPEGKLRSHLRRVLSGSVIGDEVIVDRDLAAGEQVATTGSFKLRENALVEVVQPLGKAN